MLQERETNTGGVVWDLGEAKRTVRKYRQTKPESDKQIKPTGNVAL